MAIQIGRLHGRSGWGKFMGTWKVTEARGAPIPLYRAAGPSFRTIPLRMLMAEPEPVLELCCRILRVSSGYPDTIPATPPSPPATNSLPQLLARNSGQKSIFPLSLCRPRPLRFSPLYTTLCLSLRHPPREPIISPMMMMMTTTKTRQLWTLNMYCSCKL